MHHDVDQIALLIKVVDGQDIGVIQLGDGFRFANESLTERTLVGGEGGEHLDPHVPVELGLEGLVDVGRSPAPDPGGDLVLA